MHPASQTRPSLVAKLLAQVEGSVILHSTHPPRPPLNPLPSRLDLPMPSTGPMLRRYHWDTQGCCFGRAPIGVTRKNHPTTLLTSRTNNNCSAVQVSFPLLACCAPLSLDLSAMSASFLSKMTWRLLTSHSLTSHSTQPLMEPYAATLTQGNSLLLVYMRNKSLTAIFFRPRDTAWAPIVAARLDCHSNCFYLSSRRRPPALCHAAFCLAQ